MLTERQSILLDLLVRTYIKTALPVASLKLARQLAPVISPATVRYELAALEDQGYLIQPHSSAGRLPTERGFRFYIEHLKDQGTRREMSDELRNQLSRIRLGRENFLRDLAKQLAGLTTEAVFISFGEQGVYYTGLSFLLEQPEFHELGRLANLAGLLENLDELTARVFGEMGEGLQIRLGSDNPFGSDYGSILVKVRYGSKDNEQGLVGLLGPMRMDYERNQAILKEIWQVLHYE